MRTSIVLSTALAACATNEGAGPAAESTGTSVGLVTESSTTSDEPPASSTGPTPPDDTTAVASDTTGRDTTGRDTTTGDPDDTTGAAPGCGLRGVATGLIDRYVEVVGHPRHYVVSVPDDYDPDVAYPMVLLLHGAGSEGHQFRFYSAVESSADGPAIFVYPDGLPFGDPPTKSGWDLTMDGVDLPFMDVIHDQVTSTYCVDLDRVFVGGHSFGGWMSNLLACVHGDRFAAVAPVAGGGPADGCLGSVAAWIAHGIDDPIVPTEFGEATRDYWRAANGCSTRTVATEPAPCMAFEGCDDGYDTVWCAHDEWFPIIESHTWPSFAGPAIWAFFASH
jgi:poly(3-hydroxybutyrate) depolymerase